MPIYQYIQTVLLNNKQLLTELSAEFIIYVSAYNIFGGNLNYGEKCDA